MLDLSISDFEARLKNPRPETIEKWNQIVADASSRIWTGIPINHPIFDRKPNNSISRPVYSGVYAIVVGGKFYIGQSRHLFSRWLAHRKDFSACRSHLPMVGDLVKQYGESEALFKVMCLCPPSELERIERRYIWRLKPPLNRFVAYRILKGHWEATP